MVLLEAGDKPTARAGVLTRSAESAARVRYAEQRSFRMRLDVLVLLAFAATSFSIVGCKTSGRCPRGSDCAFDASTDTATGDSSNGGATCGGFLGTPCEGDTFCDYPTDAFCGAGDQLGTCRAAPGICTGEVAPVCGCDQVTYGNACQAAAARVSVSHVGACDCVPPPCAAPPPGCNYEGGSRCECGTLVCEDP